MKIFLDTADIAEIREANDMGLIDGVTTNPSLVAKTGKPFQKVIAEICAVVDGPISAETTATEAAGMVAEGEELARIHPNVTVKIPMTTEGLKATRRLAQKGIKTNVTLVFQPLQGLLAAKCGASFVSPFIGRLDDVSAEGMAMVRDLLQMLKNYQYPTEVIVASVRHPMHVAQAALAGAHVVTIPFKVLKQLAQHPLTEIGLQKFLEDAKKIPR
jgi:transaldolase